jgi:hypothetical protein
LIPNTRIQEEKKCSCEDLHHTLMSDQMKHVKSKKPLPTHEEIEKIVHQAFPKPDAMCPGLCVELQNVIDELEDATTPKMKAQLTARLHSIGAAMKALHLHTAVGEQQQVGAWMGGQLA